MMRDHASLRWGENIPQTWPYNTVGIVTKRANFEDSLVISMGSKDMVMKISVIV